MNERTLRKEQVGPLLTVEDAALRLSVKPATIRRRILERRIDFVKIGRSVRIPERAVEKLIEAGLSVAVSDR
ncbi:MAG: excisionase family DNA-binding protein [Nitrospira sp.]